MNESHSQAFAAWRRLYDGELETYPATEEPLDVGAVAVRHPELRAARGNWPKIFHHAAPTAKAVVLIHGLKDSPGYLEDIALSFAAHGERLKQTLDS